MVGIYSVELVGKGERCNNRIVTAWILYQQPSEKLGVLRDLRNDMNRHT